MARAANDYHHHVCHVDRLRGRGVCTSRPCWLAGRDQLGALERRQIEETIRSRLGRS